MGSFESVTAAKEKEPGQWVNKATDKRGKIPDAMSIDERPAEVQGRAVSGHQEGDLIVGKGHQSAIGTLVERTNRTIILVPLRGMDAETARQAFEPGVCYRAAADETNADL